MLETRELCKTYKPKKGQPVLAVDHVSLQFPETGMVFLLGKSGSGKSTMLNLLGGLDQYDGGEIIIKGISSKDFALRLLMEHKVAAVPGTAFGACGEGYLRCCYATAQNLLEQACDKMARFCESLK